MVVGLFLSLCLCGLYLTHVHPAYICVCAHVVVELGEPSVTMLLPWRSHPARCARSGRTAPGFGDFAVSRTLSVGQM